MSNSSDEYQSALKLVHTTPFGAELVSEVASFARLLSNALLDRIEGKVEIPASLQPFVTTLLSNDMTKMAFSLLGREKLTLVMEKNLILLSGRILTYARRIDSSRLEDKLSFVLKALSRIASEASKWDLFYEESTHHIHDKKERRERRHTLQQEGKHRIADVIPKKSEAFLRSLLPILLPNGVFSLYLPAGAEVFAPKLAELLEGSIPVMAVWLENHLLSRTVKTDLLYRAFFGFHSWMQKEPSPDEGAPFQFSRALIKDFAPAIFPFCHAFLPSLFTEGVEIQGELLAEKIIGVLSTVIQSLSIESLFIKGAICWTQSATKPITLHTEQELVQLIGQISCDERIARGIVKRVIPSPELPIPTKEGKIGVMFDLLFYGLKASAAELLTKGALSSFDWEEAQRTAFERFRWFVCSPYFDQALLEAL